MSRSKRPGRALGSHPWGAGSASALLVALLIGPAHAADDAPRLPVLEDVLVTTSPLPGTSINVDKVPGNVQVLGVAALTREGPASLTGGLASHLASVNVDDNLNDAFQPDILFRGFEASPVVGTPQGLAVYQNGVRVNEAFGDAVNWDLIPDFAINRVAVLGANPVYGLNALGGALIVSMKNGFDSPGTEVELAGGSFGQRQATVEFGANDGRASVYVGGRDLHQSGWRLFSSDTLRQFYADVGFRGESASVDVSYTRADNRLQAQGAAPVQELAVDRSLVFTGPQANLNTLDFVALDATWKLTNEFSLQGALYYRHFRESVNNGNTTGYTACTGAASAGLLCQADGTTVLTDAGGVALGDISDGGAISIGENDREKIATSGRGIALQLTDTHPIAGFGNQLSLGATLDFARTQFHSSAELGVIGSQLLVAPTGLAVDTPEGSNFSATPVLLEATNRYIGVYATDTVDLSPAVSLTASARYNVATVDLLDRRGSDLTGYSRFEHLNPALGATYRLLPTLTAYAGVAVNTRAPTASEIECSDPLHPCLLPSSLAGDPPTLRQVVATTIELGLRRSLAPAGDSGYRFAWNGGLFKTRVDDDIYGVSTSVNSGFFRNVGATERRGIELGASLEAARFTATLGYSYIDATFESPLVLNSPANPFQDAGGNIHVRPGDRLPGIPRQRLRATLDRALTAAWSMGVSLQMTSGSYFHGDESNQNAPLAGHHVLSLHSAYRFDHRIEAFVTIQNVLDSRYSNFGIFGDPTGVGAPGVPTQASGGAIDSRFVSPAAPFAVYAGVRASVGRP